MIDNKKKTMDVNSSMYTEREISLSGAFPDEFAPWTSALARVVSPECVDPDEYMAADPLPMYSVGIPGIDFILGGGVTEGQSIGVGGVYASGKSVLLLQIASNLAASGAAVLYVTPELTEEEVFARAAARFAADAAVPGYGDGRTPSFRDIRRRRDPDGQPMTKANRAIASKGFAAWQKTVGDRFQIFRYKEGESLAVVDEALDAFASLFPPDVLTVVAVDPVQRMAPLQSEGMSSLQYESVMKSENERIALVATQIKDLADRSVGGEGRTMVLFGSDANAGSMTPDDSAGAGFRGGAKVGNAATTMLFLSKPRVKENFGEFLERTVGERDFILNSNPCVDDYGKPLDEGIGFGPTICTVYKNRDGPGGYIGMKLDGASSRFLDCSRVHDVFTPPEPEPEPEFQPEAAPEPEPAPEFAPEFDGIEFEL